MPETTNPTPELREWYKQGVQHLLGGRWGEAEAVHRRILAQRADIPIVHYNLGVVLRNQERLGEAISAFRAALALRPDLPQPYNDLGITLCRLNRTHEAIAMYRHALALRPEFPEVWNNLGNALCAVNQRPEAIETLRRAIALRPDFPEAWNNLGTTLQESDRLPEAESAYRRALALRPDFADSWNNLGNVLREMMQPAQAVEAFQKAISLNGDVAMAYGNLAVALKDMGRLDEALACYDQALALNSDDPTVLGSRVYTLCFHAGYDAAAIFREARRWNDRFARPLTRHNQIHINDRSPDRRLRIGYVSPNFGRHCVSAFTLPLFSQHDHRNFEIFCYSALLVPDAVTAKLRRHTDVWRDISGMSDPQAAQLMENDRIDILVDLALHMAGSRLGVFARKPAPVQVTWLGYAGTTGLDAIDYRLTDPYLDPLSPALVTSPLTSSSKSEIKAGVQEAYYSERSVHLPDSFWCYDPRGMEDDPSVQLPDPGALPALSAGHVTFGCLNNFCKVTQANLEQWARLMEAVPASRLVLVAMPGPHRQVCVQRLGVAPDRVEFVSYQPRRIYLENYRRIDICLDPLPCNGGTTSLDALWMGVPVVTQIGRTAVGRAGWSLLHNLGLNELVAQHDGDFITIATELAGDLPRLADLRSTLRGRLERSCLMDAPRFARNLEAAYRRMWQAWCQSRNREHG